MKQIEARVIGGICGNMWMPDALAGKPIRFDPRRDVIDRWATPRSRASFRDVFLAYLTREGGDFQNALYTTDTELLIQITYTRGRDVCKRTRSYRIAELADCADLVDDEHDLCEFSGYGYEEN